MRALFEAIFPHVMLVVGSGMVLYVAFARRLGIHRPQRWAGGGGVTHTAEWGIALFVFGLGVAAFSATRKWMHPGLTALGVLLALGAWVVGYCSYRRSRRRYSAEHAALRNKNAALYPGIFDHPAPTDLATAPYETLDLFDLGTYTYLGTTTKRDMLFLLDQFNDLAENGNDLFLLVESIDLLPQDAISADLRMLLKDACERYDQLTLRWTPPTLRGTGRGRS